MDLTQHDMDELKMAAEKALAMPSPFARRTVVVEANALLWLLERAKERLDMDSELDSRPSHEAVEEALKDAGVPEDLRHDVMDLLF